MSSPRTSISLEEIVLRNQERLQAIGVARSKTAEVTLLQLVAHTGELATLAYRSTPLTSFEHDEVGAILGGMMIAVATLGEAYHVDVTEATVQCMNQQLSRVDVAKRCGGGGGGATRNGDTSSARNGDTSSARNGDTSSARNGDASSARNGDASPAARKDEQPDLRSPQWMPTTPAPQGESDVLLSPITRKNFFPQLDVVAKFPPEQFNKLNLKWMAPQADGRLVEVIPDGAHLPLTHDQLPSYLEAVQPLRNTHRVLEDAPPALQALPTSVAAASASTGVTVRHVDVPAPPGYNADAVKTMFSPTHFEHGLFSPHSVAKGFDVPYPGGEESPAATTTRDSVENTTEPDASAQPRSEADFFALIRKIEAGEVDAGTLAKLQLTFSMPIGNGKVIELIPNGAQVPVSMANVDEFVTQAYESVRNHHQGKVRRTESIKRLQVSSTDAYNHAAEKEKFSPTHFTHNIFAPHEGKTKFYVDYDPAREEDCLPEALKHPNASTTVSSAKQYQEYLCSRGVEGFRGVVQQIERKPSDVRRIGVTWCIPRSLAGPSASDDDHLHDLLPNGRNVGVDEEFVTVFLGMAHKYL